MKAHKGKCQVFGSGTCMLAHEYYCAAYKESWQPLTCKELMIEAVLPPGSAGRSQWWPFCSEACWAGFLSRKIQDGRITF